MRLIAFILTFFPLILLGSGVPEGDPSKTLLDLIQNWGTLSPLAMGMGFVTLIAQALKTKILGEFFEKFKWKRALIVVLGQVYGILYLIIQGSNPLGAIIVGLISSGGAVSIYEAIKPIIKKDKE